MKRILAALLTLMLIFSMASCKSEKLTENETDASDKKDDMTETMNFYDRCENPDDEQLGIELVILDDEIIASGKTINTRWVNNSEYSIMYGEFYRIQYEQGDEWIDCGTVPPGAEIAFNSIGYMLDPGESRDKTYGLNNTYDVSVAGKYRICTNCSVYNMGGSIAHTDIDIFAEFIVEPNCDDPGSFLYGKPVIYLYPKETTEVSVQIDIDGRLTCTYPAYNNGWNVTAYPDGTLKDENGQSYNYLYWEGETYEDYCDLSKGFCIKCEDTAEFLEAALAKLGLNRREANEFIVYWLPLMQDNPYNIISFQTDTYTDAAKLNITPSPDTLIRVFMAWQASESYVRLEEQHLSAPERNGFTVIEWGGTEIKQ